MADFIDIPSPSGGTFHRKVDNLIRQQRVLDRMKSGHPEEVALVTYGRTEDPESADPKNRKVTSAEDDFIQNHFFDKKQPTAYNEDNAASTSNGPSSRTVSTEYVPAIDFGKLKFTSRRRTAARFLRFAYDGSDETSKAPDRAFQLLQDYWYPATPDLAHLVPSLVLSMIGTYHNLRMSKGLQRKVIRDSIMNIIDSFSGWVITSGNNSGIAQAVASAVAERQEIRYRKGEKTQIVCIGIAPWGNIRDCDKIHHMVQAEREKDKLPPVITYDIEYPRPKIRKPSNLQVDQSYLNDKHTHFFLPDNHKKGEEAEVAAVKFRAAFEKKIASSSQTTLITLLLEGCLTSVDLAYETILRNGPLFVIKDTGTLANIISENKNDFEITGEIVENKLRDQVAKTFFRIQDYNQKEGNERVESTVEKIMEICKSQHVTIINFQSQKDLDFPILRRMEADTKDKGLVEVHSILEYSMHLDRTDIACDIVKNPDFDIDKEEPVFMTAIISNKVSFVKLLVDNGMDMGRFLKKENLETIYAKTEPMNLQQILPFKKKKKKKKESKEEEKFPYLNSVEKFLIQATNCSARYAKPKDFKDPFHELMIYAVFCNRMELADYFWSQTDRPLLSALVAAWLAQVFKKYFLRRFNYELTKSYRDMKSAFEERAIKLLDFAYNNNQGWARDLVMSAGRPQWSHLTLIEIAAEGRLQAFLGHSACQKEIFQKWTQGYDCNRKKYICSFLLFFPMFSSYFVRFERDVEIEKQYIRSTTCFGRETTPIPSACIPQTPSAETDGRIKFPVSTQISTRSEEVPETFCQKCRFRAKKPVIFYRSPCSKFGLHSLGYTLYLALYSFVLLFAYRPGHLPFWEILLYFWQTCYFFETINIIMAINANTVRARIWTWLHNGSFGTWNTLEFVNFCFIIPTLLTRLLSLLFPWLHSVAHVGMAGGVIVAFLRLFKILFVIPYFGPKVIMIWRMTAELLMFFMFFAIFLFAYSVASKSFTHQNLEPYIGIFWDLFRHGLWEMYGEPVEEHTLGKAEGCDSNYTGWDWFQDAQSFDCFVRNHSLIILLALYLFVSSVLLMNMLIAVFTHIFDTVNDTSEQLWRYQMYFFVREYDKKFFLPPPLGVIYQFYLLWNKLMKAVSVPVRPVKAKKVDKALKDFERQCVYQYYRGEEDTDTKILATLSRLEQRLDPKTNPQARRHLDTARHSYYVKMDMSRDRSTDDSEIERL